MELSKNKNLAAISLAALGIVYGDIGTSPLYAFEQVFSNGSHSVPISELNVLGILSLFFWSLMFIVTLKYVLFIMRADNNGEGGVIALMALALRKGSSNKLLQKLLLVLGLIGASFFYGDGVITPAISVLSAVEGLEILSPSLKSVVLPSAIVILLGLFWYQKKGTGSIGILFGPIMAIWFLTIGCLGGWEIIQNPIVLKAINPYYALSFLYSHSILSFFALGAVVLCLTGAEALYADMGHFGVKPIKIMWLNLVLPALLLNYFGQGALLLSHPEVLDNLFYMMAPTILQTPLVLLATLATVIASQAVISGTFSMTNQAIQLGFFPSLKILQTSAHESGQIFIPVVNVLLAVGVVAVILIFKSSNALGSAYGIAVTGTMLITDFLALAMVVRIWGWSKTRAWLGAFSFIVIDVVFFSSNTLKVLDGGWLPLVFSVGIVIVMSTWYQGRLKLIKELKEKTYLLENFISSEAVSGAQRIKGSAIYMASDYNYTPIALLRTIKHFGGIHDLVGILSLSRELVPYIKDEERVHVTNCGNGFAKINIRCGFMEKISIPDILKNHCPKHLAERLLPLSYFISRQIIGYSKNSGMFTWRKFLFKFLYRNAQQPLEFFDLPEDDTIVVSIKVDI